MDKERKREVDSSNGALSLSWSLGPGTIPQQSVDDCWGLADRRRGMRGTIVHVFLIADPNG